MGRNKISDSKAKLRIQALAFSFPTLFHCAPCLKDLFYSVWASQVHVNPDPAQRCLSQILMPDSRTDEINLGLAQ